MRKFVVIPAAAVLGLFSTLAVAQHTAPGAPAVQGQQRPPGTFIAPEGSAPEIGELNGETVLLTMSDIEGAPVINEFGERIGTVSRVFEGDAGYRYVSVMIDDERPVVFPIMLMGVHADGLVVRGYGRDLLRAQSIDPGALEAFAPVHRLATIEMPQVSLRRE